MGKYTDIQTCTLSTCTVVFCLFQPTFNIQFTSVTARDDQRKFFCGPKAQKMRNRKFRKIQRGIRKTRTAKKVPKLRHGSSSRCRWCWHYWWRFFRGSKDSNASDGKVKHHGKRRADPRKIRTTRKQTWKQWLCAAGAEPLLPRFLGSNRPKKRSRKKRRRK